MNNNRHLKPETHRLILAEIGRLLDMKARQGEKTFNFKVNVFNGGYAGIDVNGGGEHYDPGELLR